MIWLQQSSSPMKPARLQASGALRVRYATASDQTFVFKAGDGAMQMQWHAKF